MNLRNHLLIDDHYNLEDLYQSHQEEGPAFVLWIQFQKFGYDSYFQNQEHPYLDVCKDNQ